MSAPPREGGRLPVDAIDVDATEAARAEWGRRLFAQACTFVTGAASEAALPAPDLDEVAFAGRSNVGKSSLLNALTGRRALARTSQAPGRTRQINFFRLGDRLMLVDLPGYGYARAPRKDIRGWTRLMHAYIEGRPNLRRLCLLVDCRRGLGDADRALMDLMDASAVVYQVVLTKADKSTAPALAHRMAVLAGELGKRLASHPRIVATSARTGAGIAELRADLAALAPPRPDR